MDWQVYKVRITLRAEKQLKKLAKKLGKPLFGQFRSAIEGLERDPLGQTQVLGGRLRRYRSLHVGRCRAVVRIDNTSVTVYVIASDWHEAGDRNDVYEKLMRQIDEGGGEDLDAHAEDDSPSPA